MSTNESSPNIETNETNVQNNLSTQSGYPNMSNEKTFIVQNGLLVEGDAVVTGTVTATSFIGDGSQLTGISGGGGGGLDSAAVTLLVDSDYVALRAPAGGGGGLDSASVQSLIDAEVDATTLVLGAETTAGIKIGKNTSASTLSGGGIAIGQNANATGTQGIAIGIGAEGDNNAIGIGIGAETANSSVSIGRYAVSRSQGTTMGTSSEAVSSAVAFGYNAKGGSTAFGTGDYSVAVGANSNARYNSNIHINANYNSGVGPTADGGLVIETASARLEYSADSDWVFNAPVTSSEFKFADGTSMTTAATGGGGGLDSAGVTALINEPYLRDTLYDVAAAQTNIGLDAGFASTSNFSIAIGKESGINSGNATNSIAIGFKAGQNISDNSIMIGRETAEFSPVSFAVGIGTEALQNTAGNGAIAVGYRAGQNNSGDNSVSIGRESKGTGSNSIAIGYGAGNTTGGDGAVLIGTNAGQSAHQRLYAVAVGMNAQLENDANVSASVAVGYEAGKIRQESSTVAIGYKSGETDQLNSATAVGFQAGNTSQGGSSVAIGRDAAFTGQATNSVAIGRSAGYENQGTRSIAIGRQAGATNQGANNIILNATSGALNRTDQFGIDIRTSAAGSLTYDTTNDWTFGAGVTMTDLTASGATVVFNNLPTTDPVNAGQLWNDAGTLKVSAG